MELLAAVPYVNRPDLLRGAVDSLRPLHDRLVLVDNSPPEGALDPAAWPGRVLRPPVPLSYSQTQNLLQGLLLGGRAEALVFAHSDMACEAHALQRLLRALDRLERQVPGWGVVFTRYDVLAAFHRRAVERVGPWDVALPWYSSDMDWYHRVDLAGLRIVQLGGEGVRHVEGPSATIRADWRLRHRTAQVSQLSRAYYRVKWGGPPTQERYTVPFDGEGLHPPLELLRAEVDRLDPGGARHLLAGAPDRVIPRLRTLGWVVEQARPRRVRVVGGAGDVTRVLAVLAGCPVEAGEGPADLVWVGRAVPNARLRAILATAAGWVVLDGVESHGRIIPRRLPPGTAIRPSPWQRADLGGMVLVRREPPPHAPATIAKRMASPIAPPAR